MPENVPVYEKTGGTLLGAILTIASAVLGLLPSLVQGVENLFNLKGAVPQSGAQKADTVANLAQNALVLAGVIDAGHFGQPEMNLVANVRDALVTYFNTKGIFQTSSGKPVTP